MSLAVGSLVRARGREWVVLPGSTDELVLVRPAGGSDIESTGILTVLEDVRPATFAPPDPERVGDDRSARLLRDALRLGFRSSAGPFRCFGSIAVEPRPYQLVPLLMALRLEPVRLLIADDVGIGKTIEAALVARELIEQGDAGRLAVLCPPHLAEQWRGELRSKFHIEAVVVGPSTAGRLERECTLGQTLFEIHPNTIVSTDYIKSERRRTEFLRTCPELVIVDEAHTCTLAGAQRGRHQRHALVAGLAKDPTRHLVLVTATPHSGDEGAFRSLLALLDPAFGELPDDLSGPAREGDRRRIARNLIQRRRPDIRRYLDETTSFPEREDAEETWSLTPQYKQLFERAIRLARETVGDEQEPQHRRRVRWWSALALLRSLASSPAAAAATLRQRAKTAEGSDAEEVDEIGARTVFDLDGIEDEESADVVPGSDWEPDDGDDVPLRRRLRDMAKAADDLCGKSDPKLTKAVQMVQKLLSDGFSPIVFCRFIPTAEYVAAHLRRALAADVAVESVTGLVPSREREGRIAELGKAPRRVLVATDCLSEGINLQHAFDAVVHYDLSWNPTRHEQRAGRVDRFGQVSTKVRVVTYYGRDNQIDGLVLEVLLRKHKRIRDSLGISVPLPGDGNTVIEAILEGLLLRRRPDESLDQLALFEEEMLSPTERELLREWDRVADREKRSRTMYAQDPIRVEEVARELAEAREAVGGGDDAKSFLVNAIEAMGGTVAREGEVLDIRCDGASSALLEAVDERQELRVTFDPSTPGHVEVLSRTHPLVERIAGHILESALEGGGEGPARRSGAIRTAAVARRTTLLLLRYRLHLVVEREDKTIPLLVEDCGLLAFAGPVERPEWLDHTAAQALLAARPSGNIAREAASDLVREVVDGLPLLGGALADAAHVRAQAVLDAHRRVRKSAQMTRVRHRVEPQIPPDVLGVFIYLPQPRVG